MTISNGRNMVSTCWACDAVVVLHKTVYDKQGDMTDANITVEYVKIENKQCKSQPGVAWVCPHCKAWNHVK